MEFKSEYYNATQIDSLVFNYGFKEGIIKNKSSLILNIPSLLHKNLNLPISMNPSDYGRLVNIKYLENSEFYTIHNDKGQTISFEKFENYNEVEISKAGISLVKFKDVLSNENNFTRTIDNKKFYFENNQQILSTTEIKTDFIAKTHISKNIVNNFITLDIETYIDDNGLYPYLISFYDGNKSYSFGL
jgi:hypothetical protein